MFAFRHHGKDYYQYPEQLGMPMFRVAELSKYNIWISRGLTTSQLTELVDVADKLLYDGLGQGKNAAKIGAIFTELREREKKAVPVDIWYNYLACAYVREDESEKSFNEQIQREKASIFKDAANDADSFFFLLPELKTLTQRSSILPTAWRSILQESMIQQNRHKELFEILKP